MWWRSVIAVVLMGEARPFQSSKRVSGGGMSFSVSLRNAVLYLSLGSQLRCGALWCIMTKKGLPVASAPSITSSVTLVMFSVAYSPRYSVLTILPSFFSQNHGSK